MVDIHSHILYGIDDGARTVEDSVAMLEMAADCGTTDIVATPHSDEVRPAWMARAMTAKRMGTAVSSSSIAEKRTTATILKTPSKQMAVPVAKVAEFTVASAAIAAPAAAALFLPLLVTESPHLNSRKGSRGLARFWR